MVLEDITGKALSAVDVFTLSIKALVDHLLGMLKKQGNIFDEVQWYPFCAGSHELLSSM
jgi:hypothetical protein